MTVPALGTSMVMQRIVNLERKHAQEQIGMLQARVAELEAEGGRADVCDDDGRRGGGRRSMEGLVVMIG